VRRCRHSRSWSRICLLSSRARVRHEAEGETPKGVGPLTATHLFIALAVAADGLAGLVGGLLSERWLQRHQAALVGFAAGALLGAAFLDVLPEAFDALGQKALPWAFVGFLVFLVMEWLAGHHHHREIGTTPSTLPASLLASDALHNVADGAALASAFLISPRVGVAVALAIVAHEVPQEVGDYALLRASGFSRGRALLSLATLQLTAAIGAVGVIAASGRFRQASGIVLSIAAGSFLYIGATDLLPELHSGRTPSERRGPMLGFVAGVALIVLASALGARAGSHGLEGP
jgi:zinc and cadmium transporter